jgi:hypothetical protein
MYGLKADDDINCASAKNRVGELIRHAVLLTNEWMSVTVALPPDLSQIESNTLKDFEDPNLANIISVADATNIVHDKLHTPSGDKQSYSDYYGANCGKIEVSVTCFEVECSFCLTCGYLWFCFVVGRDSSC